MYSATKGLGGDTELDFSQLPGRKMSCPHGSSRRTVRAMGCATVGGASLVRHAITADHGCSDRCYPASVSKRLSNSTSSSTPTSSPMADSWKPHPSMEVPPIHPTPTPSPHPETLPSNHFNPPIVNTHTTLLSLILNNVSDEMYLRCNVNSIVCKPRKKRIMDFGFVVSTCVH